MSASALPGPVTLSLVRSLCPRAEGVSALTIETKTQWSVAFPNGWRVALVCGPTVEEGPNCTSTWTGKGGPQQVRATLSPNGDQSFRVEYLPNAAQNAQTQKRMAIMSKGPPAAVTARMQKTQAAFSECTKLAQAKAIACMQERSPALQKASEAYGEAMKKLAGPEGPPLIGCERTRFDVAGTQVEAEGDDCGEAGSRLEKGTGTVQHLP